MRRLQRATGARHTPGLDGLESEHAVGVRRRAAKATEAFAAVVAAAVGLPDLDQRVVHRLAVAVDDATLDGNAFAGYAGGRELFDDQPGQADMQVRPDSLRGGGVQAH